MKALFVLVALLFASVASAGNVTLNWTFNATDCADGSALSNCAATGFEIQEQVNGVWTVKNGVAATARTTSYTNVAAGRHCYRVRTNANGTFSVPSNEACIDVPASAPRAPVITVTITVTD
jgi:hypothetical protein